MIHANPLLSKTIKACDASGAEPSVASAKGGGAAGDAISMKGAYGDIGSVVRRSFSEGGRRFALLPMYLPSETRTISTLGLLAIHCHDSFPTLRHRCASWGLVRYWR